MDGQLGVTGIGENSEGMIDERLAAFGVTILSRLESL